MRGYQKHVISAEAPGPMSREELEREEIRAQEASTAGVDSKAAVVSGKFLNIDADFPVFFYSTHSHEKMISMTKVQC